MDCAKPLLFNQTYVELKHHSCLLLLFVFNTILLLQSFVVSKV